MTLLYKRVSVAALLCACLLRVAAGESLNKFEDLLHRGHVSAALEGLQEHLAQSPDDDAATLLLARAFGAADQHDQAIDALRRVEGSMSIGPFERAEELARATWSAGETHQARAIWRRLLATFPTMRPEDFPAPELRAAARAAWALGREDPALYRLSLNIYEQLIANSGDDDPDGGRLELGRLLLARYNSGEAFELFKQVIERAGGQHVQAMTALAEAQQFDHLRSAEDTVDAVLKIDPAFEPALILRARLHLEMEEFEAAGKLLDVVFALNPNARKGLALRAALAFLQEDEETFNTTMEMLRSRGPRSGDHLVTLAEIAARNRRYAQAAEFALIAVNTEPRAWPAYALLGINRMRQGDVESGRRALEISFGGDPFNIWTRNTLALLDKMKGFAQLRSEHFVFVSDAREAAVIAPHLLPLAEQAYATFVTRYEHTPQTPIRIEMFANHEDFSVRTAGLIGLDILGVSFGPVVALDSPSAGESGSINWGSVVWHELAHSFHLSKSRHRAPRWFSEGLAVYEEHTARSGWGADVGPDFLQAHIEGKLPSPSKLNAAFLRPTYPRQVIHGYMQGSVFIDFLVQEHGFGIVNQLLDGFAVGGSLETLSPVLLGYDLDGLDRRFGEYFSARFAVPLDALASEEGQRSHYGQLLYQAKNALEADALELAQQRLLSAQRILPSHTGAGSPNSMLVDLYEKLGRVDEAIIWMTRSTAINADDAPGHRRLAHLLTQAGRHSEATDVWQQSLFINPFDPFAHQRIAEMHESSGNWSGAVSARDAVVALGPEDPVVAHQELARALVEVGDYDRARVELLTAL
ncbi:MAG: hypothetical protein HOI95_13875, partial [Chromatiales bacterium]|nr:hypothetical protein [Chromatiales bacterium]